MDDGKLRIRSNGCYFIQSKALKLNNTVNIYIVYRLNPISSTRNADYTVQNALFGAMKITKNIDYSKNNYTGYGLCCGEGVHLLTQYEKVILTTLRQLETY